MKLLVVDDHSLIREAVRHVVQALAESVTVLTAADCEEGFAVAERESGGDGELELLLLDFNLRGLSGVPAIRAWCQRHPALPVDERTVKAHVTEVLRALGVSSRTQAALAAARLGLADVPPSPGPAGIG